ncbi:MAG: ArnT family glycosyltransferase [Chloroflexota bacterium]
MIGIVGSSSVATFIHPGMLNLTNLHRTSLIQPEAQLPATMSHTRGLTRVVDLLGVFGLFGTALALRVITSTWYGASISTDEYRYALIAQEWSRLVHGLSALHWDDLIIYHPLVPWLAGVVSLAAPWDQLSIGRGLQLLFNAALAPLAFGLARWAGLSWLYAFISGALLSIMPGVWEMSTAFWPDSQLAALSTLTLIGLVAAIHGHRTGWLITLVSLAAGILTKEHVFLLILPAAAITLLHAVQEQILHPRHAAIAMSALALSVVFALAASVYAPFLPRAAVVWLLIGRPATPLQQDGLPIFAQAGEEVGAQSWVAAALIGALTGQLQLERIATGLGLRVWGPGMAALGLAGVIGQMTRLIIESVQTGRPRTRASAIDQAARTFALLGALCLGLVFIWQLSTDAFPLNAIWMGAATTLGILGATTASSHALARWLMSGLCWYVAGTIGFFMLPHEILHLETRYVLPAFPVFGLFMALGLREAIVVSTPVVRGLPTWLAVLIAGSLVAIIVPGGPLRKGGILLLSALAAAAVRAKQLRDIDILPGLMPMTALILLTVATTPTLTTIARARDFKGYPDDPSVRGAAGAARVATLREAEPWLRQNVKPTDVIITSKPYQVAWHSGSGFSAFQISRVWDEIASNRRRYLVDDLLRNGAYDWVIDFNQYAIQPQSAEGPLFVEDYQWLRGRSYLQESYTVVDYQGRLMLFAFRHPR